MPRDTSDRRERDVEETPIGLGAGRTKGVGRRARDIPVDLGVTIRRPARVEGAATQSAETVPGATEEARPTAPRAEVFRVAERWVGTATSRGGLSLIPTVRSSAEGYSIVVRDDFRMGRSTGEVDFVTWFLPRSPRNDVLTRRISRVHAKIMLEGGELWISDCGTTNGTTMDSVAVKDRVAVPLSRPSEVMLAGEYRVIVDPLPVPILDLRIEGLSIGPESAPRGAVRFHAAEGLAPDPKPVWLLRQTAFGRGPGCGVRLPDESLEELSGIFCLIGGVVWVGVVATECCVSVDGTPLEQGDLAPLKGYRSLKIGRLEFRVEAL